MSGLVNFDRDQANKCLNQAYLWIEALKFNDRGLVPVIVQNECDAKVLQLAWMDKTLIRQMFEGGEILGLADVMKVKSIFYDCDRDTLLLKVEQLLS